MVLLCPILCDKNNGQRMTILIKRDKPDWQRGKMNLPGGRIREDEAPWVAASREFLEHTGIAVDPGELTYVGAITNTLSLRPESLDRPVFVYTVRLSEDVIDQLADEKVMKTWCGEIVDALCHPDLIPDLTFIIPRCMERLAGWNERCSHTIAGSMQAKK